VTVTGHEAKEDVRFDAELSAEGDRARAVVKRRVPYTIEKVAVERNGQARGGALTLSLKDGATYEVRVGPDGAAEVVESKGAAR
jgi:hypothetical protein